MRAHLSLFAILAACSSIATPRPPAPGSRGPRADQHLDAARDHARRASELSRWPETRPDGNGTVNDPVTGLWYRRFDTARDEERLAATHRSAAARLHAQYDEACGTRPVSEIAVSPLERYGRGGVQLQDGVVIYLDLAAGDPDRLLAAIRCHRAWMMLGASGMEACPLDLADLHFVAHGDRDGISLEITTPNAAVIPELHRRAALELEQAARHR